MATLVAAMARAAPEAAAIPAGAVARAEVAAAEVVRRVRPTEASERRRAGVVDYARRLVGAALGCEVFAFGSVPLKTYLPDGDIDLTVLGNTSYHSTLVEDIYCILKSEEQNSDAEFEVKDLQHINAEVRLIKCTIENIIIDISFNQTGGICSLCFLELVDCRVGKKHLFKRSIILIKAWCYYESRLLGAHHGLISTYALETLILYIFNLFHKSLHGPLEVLYRFLEYFSKFDWENYCISLNGPVALSSLPDLIVEATNAHDDDLLFDKEFLRSSMDKAFLPPRDSNEWYNKFRVKHLNIIDPLKEHNNLGRSVNRASFNRIRTAFSYGARKLGQILMLPSEHIPDEICGFFINTLKRNGRGVRPDIGNDGYDSSFYFQPCPSPGKALLEDISSMKISYKKEDENRSPRHLSKCFAYNYSNIKTNGSTHLRGCFPGDHKVASNTDLSSKSSHFVHHTPKQHSLFYQENGNGGSEQYYMDHEIQAHVSRCTAETFHVDDRLLMRPQVHTSNSSHTLNSSTRGNTLELSKPGPINKKNLSATVTHVEKYHPPPFSSLSLPDLSGDLDSQLRCLRQVQYHLEYLFDGFLQSVQEASSDAKVDKDSFQIPTLSILLNTDVILPRLLLPSSAVTDGRKSSSVSSCTEDVSPHSQDEDHWGMASQQNASGTDVPSNGLSPSSSYADWESSVSLCHISEDIPNMHGTGPHIPEKHMASLEEKGKALIDQPVQINKQQVALDSGIKEIMTSHPLKVQDSQHGCIRSYRKTIEKQSCHTQKECVKPGNEARQIRSRRYYGDVCSNTNLFQKRNYDTHMAFVQPASALKQMPKHQLLEVQDTPNECTHIKNNLARKQSYDIPKGQEILDWPTEHVPISEPLKLQSSLRGRVRLNNNSAAKQNYGNRKEHLSFVRDTEHVPSSQALSILNGSKRVVNSKELDENGNKPRPLLPKEPLSASNICRPSFPVMEGYCQPGEAPLEETIEFGSLGPFSLTFFPSKSNKAANTLPTNKACADASALVLQSYRAGAAQSRSLGLRKLGNEDHSSPLRAGTR